MLIGYKIITDIVGRKKLKPYQKVITFILVLVLVLASFGFIAGMQATHAQVTAQSMPAPAQVRESLDGGPALAFMLGLPEMVPNVSWNS